jgi:hypothetical protein
MAAALIVASFGAGSLQAQTPEIVPRLPENTVALVEWHGTSALAAAAQQSHVVQLMDDPGLAPLWLGIAANVQKSEQNKKGPAPALSMTEVVSLLQNPAAAGIIEIPRAAENAAAKNSDPVAMFVVYDSTGKAAIIQKWESATETRGPKPPKLSHFDFSGTSVDVRTYEKSTTYLATARHYFVMSDQKTVIEELIHRFGQSNAPADSLAQRPEYAEVQKFVGSDGALDFFARVPNIRDLASAAAKGKNPAGLKFIESLHLEKVHAAGGSVSFAGEAMHMRGVILGNTQPVGPLDFAGTSSASFQTLAIASGSPDFSVSRINFGAMFRLIMGAATAVFPERQAADLQAAEGMAQGFLGISISDALDLFTGELASTSSYSSDGGEQRIFAATIQKPDEVLHVLRTVLGPMTLAEDTFGDATLLDIAVPHRDPATGLQRRTMYYVAVTPQMVLVAQRKAMLRETLESQSAPAVKAAPMSKGVLADPEYLQLRAKLPEKLSGLGAEDLAQIPWAALWANLENRAEQSAKQSPHVSKSSYSSDASWMKLVNPDVIPRHLHMAVSGWWKDSNGVYFDSYVQ